MEKETKFIVVPKGSFTYESLGEFLNTFYRTDGEEIHFRFGTVPKDGFYIPHEIITKIKSTQPEWNKATEFYSQEGGGKIRVYSIPARKKTVKEKKAIVDLKEIVGRKK